MSMPNHRAKAGLPESLYISIKGLPVSLTWVSHANSLTE